jgi:hypothetical protein
MDKQRTVQTEPTARANQDAKGKFVAGNRAAANRRVAVAMSALRQALATALTPAEVKKLARTLYKQAMRGDTAAAKLVLDRAVPAVPADVLAEIEELRAALEELKHGVAR